MIKGTVNSTLEAIIQLSIRDAQGKTHDFEAVIDTGFNGSLTLSPQSINTLRLPWVCRQQGILADGSIQVFDVHAASVLWDGTWRDLEVEAAGGQALCGMEMLKGLELRVHVQPGGIVSIGAP